MFRFQPKPIAIFGGAQLVGTGFVAFGFGSVGTFFFGLELSQQLLHPLAVSGGFDQLPSAPAAGDEVQIFAGQLGQLF